MKKKFSTRVLAEIAIFAAIGFALDVLQGGIFKGVWPNGGSVGFAMVPVFVIAYRRGLIPGLLCGLILSLVQMLGGIYVLPAASFDNKFMQAMGPFFQVMLDYVLAYFVVGFAGAFSGLYKKSENMKLKLVWISIGVIVGGLLKYACHVASGYFWLDPKINFWGVNGGTMLYSFIYNLYAVFNIFVCLPIMILIARFYPKFLNPDDLTPVEPKVILTEKESMFTDEDETLDLDDSNKKEEAEAAESKESEATELEEENNDER